MLDASRAFDSVKIYELFEELLAHNMSPLVLRFSSVLYTNQTLQAR